MNLDGTVAQDACEEGSAQAARARFMPWRSLCTRARLWVGMAAFLSWTNLLFGFEGVLRDQVTEAGGLVHDPLVHAAMLVAGVVLPLALLAGRGRGGLPGLGTSCVPADIAVTVAGMVCSAVAVVLTNFAPQSVAWAPYALGVVLGVCFAFYTLVWGRRLAMLDLREALLMVTAASCVQWLPFVLVALTTAPVHIALAALMPCVSGVLQTADEVACPAEPAVRAGVARSQAAVSKDARTLVRLTLTMFVFSATIELVWCFFVKMLPGHLHPDLFALLFVTTFVVAGIVGFACALGMDRARSYRLEFYYRACMLLCLCGVAATGMAAFYSSGVDAADLPLFATYTTVYAGYSLVLPTMWMLSLGYAFLKKERPERVLGWVFAGQYLGFFVGAMVVEALKRSSVASYGQQIVPLAVFCCVAALGVAYLAVFPERSLLSLSPLMFGMSHESVDARSEQIAREGGLTAREAEVLALLARGRDVAYICSELGISRNTVGVHRKNIYAKLNIHSQQDLLSLVEEPGYEEG